MADNIPFWKKIIQNKTNTKKTSEPTDEAPQTSSLVESIVRQAEEQVRAPADTVDPVTQFEEEEKQTYIQMSRANTVLSSVIIVSIAVWVFFFAILNEHNSIYATVGSKNLTATAAEKEIVRDELATNVTYTSAYIGLLQAEQVARRVVALPEAPTPRVNREQTQEAAEPAEISSYRDVLRGLVVASEEVAVRGNMPPELRESIESMQARLVQIDTFEDIFPSADTRASLQSARQHAKQVLSSIKTENLKNIITDLKNQVRSIDTSNLDEDGHSLVTELRAAVERINHRDPNSITRAIAQTRSIDTSSIDDTVAYAQIISLIGTGGETGDLSIAAAIAENLGRATLIAEIDTQRIAWSQVMSNIQRIASYGADLSPDSGIVYADSRRDIGISDADISFTGFAGKQDRSVIEVRGQAQMLSESDRNFSLLADLIDALEGSIYFQDVDGFTFSNNRTATGDFFAPIGLRLELQDPGLIHEADAPQREEANKLITRPTQTR